MSTHVYVLQVQQSMAKTKNLQTRYLEQTDA